MHVVECCWVAEVERTALAHVPPFDWQGGACPHGVCLPVHLIREAS